MTQQNRFLFGGSFVPLALETHVPMSQWEDGMRQMHDLGFTAYRAFVAWNRIEGREGIRDFRELDYSLELAARYDLSVTLNVGGIFGNLQGFRPPPWLQYGCHCQHRMPHPDSPSSPNTPDLLLCNDDPVYREKALAFMRDVVARYARHPALECWAVWNEPAGNPCYCPHTLRLFRNWLQSRYASLDQLNAAWGTLFPLGFPAWDDVRPAAMEDSHVSKAQRIDWLTFCERHMEEQVNEVDRLVKEVDPAHPTSLNLQGVHARDFTRFRMSQIGISAYLEHDRYDARGVYQWVNVYMHSARAGHRPEEKIRIIETDSGPRALSERHPGDPAAAEARDWAFIAQGAGMILAWIYRTRISGGHACQSSLTAWDGSATERLRRAGRRAQVLRAHGARILQAHPFPGQVGVLHDKKLWRLSHVEGFHHPDRNYCMTAQDHGLMVLRDAGYAAEYLMDSQVLDGTIARFPAVLMPFCPFVSPELGAALRAYVLQGGTLIAETPLAIKDDQALQYWQGTPGAGLEEVFGFRAVDLGVFGETDALRLNDGTVLETASDFRTVIEPHSQAEVLGRYRDGAPAVVANRLGRGRTLFFGSLMLRRYSWAARSLRDMLADFIEEQAGTPPLVRIGPELAQNPLGGALGVYPVTHNNRTLDGLYLVNFNKVPVAGRLQVGPERLLLGRFADLITGAQTRARRGPGGWMLDAALGPLQSQALFVED